MSKVKKTTMLRKIMDKKTVNAIGAQDVFSARIVERTGFDAVYLSGFTSEGSFLGRPDIGLMTETERLMIARNMANAVDIPLIVDAEEGYGNAIHVMDAVQRFEEAGAAAMHIDDEVIPCRCPFLTNIPENKLIPTEVMCGKIRAAVEARNDPDFLIIARSDVISTVSLDQFRKEKKFIMEEIRRSNEYVKAGADVIFTYCLTLEQYKLCAKLIKAPLMAALPETNQWESLLGVPMKVFEELGYKIMTSAAGTIYTAAKGMIEGLKAFKETLNWKDIQEKRITPEEYFDIIELKEYESLYRKFDIRV